MSKMGLALFSVTKALLTRLLFAAHCLLTVWRVVHVYQQEVYWFLLTALGVLLLESCITLIKRKGKELKWFCPSFLIYLCGVVPGIWFLELDRLERYRTENNTTFYEPVSPITMTPYLTETQEHVIQTISTFTAGNASGLNVTHVPLDSYSSALFNESTESPQSTGLSSHILSTLEMVSENGTKFPTNVTEEHQIYNMTAHALYDFNMVKFPINGTPRTEPIVEMFEIPLELDADTWVNSIEQSMLLLLIIGRWLLPKGDITRDQLSQLLFVYIGMASDIMELYTLFQEPKVLHDETIGFIILGVWSLSLIQFTLVLTATKSRKPRVVLHRPDYERQMSTGGCCSCFCESEVWSIFIMVLLQDAPFLTIRLYVIITFKLLTYNILFFTAKNALIILLQFYRLVVICINLHKYRAEATANAQATGFSNAPINSRPKPEPRVAIVIDHNKPRQKGRKELAEEHQRKLKNGHKMRKDRR